METHEDLDISNDTTRISKIDLLNDIIVTLQQEPNDLNIQHQITDGKQNQFKQITMSKSKLKSDSQTLESKLKGLKETKAELEELLNQKQNLTESMSAENSELNELQKSCNILKEESKRLTSEIMLTNNKALEQYNSSLKIAQEIKKHNLLKNITGIEWNNKESTETFAVGFINEEDRFSKFSHDQEDQSTDNSVWNRLRKGDGFSNTIFDQSY